MSNTATNVEERFAEIAHATAAEAQVRTIVALAKSPRLGRNREERLVAWGELADTVMGHLNWLKQAATPRKVAKKRSTAEVPIKHSLETLGEPTEATVLTTAAS